MAVAKDHAAMLKKLKAQVKLLKKKEEQGRHQLHAAFKNIHKIGTVFKNKLEKRMQVMHDKMMTAQATSYVKAAVDIERQILNKIKRKSRSVVEAIAQFEKHQGKKKAASVKKSGKSKTRKGK